MTRRGIFVFLAGLAVAFVLPIAAARLRPLPPGRCERDGVDVSATPAAEVVDAAGRRHDFCSIRCAKTWLERTGGRGVRVLVRDEVSGATIDARSASFVRSFAAGVSGDRTHAFSTIEEARSHCVRFGGALLEGAERPFHEFEVE